MLPKEHERDVVRHQQRRNPECGNPVGRAHVGLRPIDCGQSYSTEEVQGSCDVEDPHQESSARNVSNQRKNRDQGKQGGEQVSESCRIGKLRRDSSIGGSSRQLNRNAAKVLASPLPECNFSPKTVPSLSISPPNRNRQLKQGVKWGYASDRAITKVMSSCCSPPVNCCTAPTIAWRSGPTGSWQ